MNRAEAATLLTVAAAFDQRTIGETDAVAWSEALRRYGLAECRDAVIAHYAESTDRVMPAHIRARIRTGKSVHRPVGEVLEQARPRPEDVRRAEDYDFGGAFGMPT